MSIVKQIDSQVSQNSKLRPGEIRKHGSYTAKPQSNVWFSVDVLDEVKSELKKIGFKYRIIYRGPRGHYENQSMTWRQDAYYFTIHAR